ncbi:MAG: WecB/TagA/CpsF family glycosyltransferase [Treponema sp.]|nr:WecB/TagA/CpsF family glycosyltransferase [Treponema sp.]
MPVQRIDVLGVPVDILPPQEMEETLLGLLEKEGTKQIIFMTIWDLLRARRKNDYAQCVRDADLILPVSKSILRGARFLKRQVPVRYNPFNAVISILSVLEEHLQTLYILGGRKKTLMTAEKNVRSTFRSLQIVGRYVGYYPKTVEDDVIQAIKKSSPSLALISEGVREKDCWSYNRRERFSKSIFLYYHDAVGIFSERIRRVNEKTFERGNEIWSEIFKNPLKIVLIFPFLWYTILLVWHRLFKKS